MDTKTNTYLLVDDNEVFANLLVRGFKRFDYELSWVTNKQDALNMEGDFDGIILDLNLDGESGLQLLPLLKEKFPRSKIIILTGYASISTAVNAIKLGAFYYLPKPASVESILQAFEGASDEDLVNAEISKEQPSLKRLTWENIHFVLEQNNGNITQTAKALNLHRRTLQRMLNKYPSTK